MLKHYAHHVIALADETFSGANRRVKWPKISRLYSARPSRVGYVPDAKGGDFEWCWWLNSREPTIIICRMENMSRWSGVRQGVMYLSLI